MKNLNGNTKTFVKNVGNFDGVIVRVLMNGMSSMIINSKSRLRTFFKLMNLDLECLMSTREGRSRIQDIVYLAEAHGIDLGYKFQWYSGDRGA